MRKLLAILLLLSALLPIPSDSASAKSSHRAPVCYVQACKRTASHRHGGKAYRAHSSKDGHAYHMPLCARRACTAKGVHRHSGTSYRPHAKSDGHSYHRSAKRHH